jgi:Sec-independent protein secretion pathway component TatC
MLLLRKNWRHIVVWLLIGVAASSWTPGVDPFTPLIATALGVGVYEVGRRWISREARRRSVARQLPHSRPDPP